MDNALMKGETIRPGALAQCAEQLLRWAKRACALRINEVSGGDLNEIRTILYTFNRICGGLYSSCFPQGKCETYSCGWN
jgi:hypothetical protein